MTFVKMQYRNRACGAVLLLLWVSHAWSAPPVYVEPAPAVARGSASASRSVRDGSSRRGLLLRSNVGLTGARIGGVPEAHPEHAELDGWRFATANHLSIGYGWRKDLAWTIDGFRMVVPHRPHAEERARFDMRVDAEVLGLGLGTTTYYPPLSLHVGQTIGFVMARVGGGLLDAPRYRGIGGVLFVGYELMRSERIGIVLAAQALQALTFDQSSQLVARSYGFALGVTYW